MKKADNCGLFGSFFGEVDKGQPPRNMLELRRNPLIIDEFARWDLVFEMPKKVYK